MSDRESVYLLACESSCDETAFCIYDITEKTILASVIHSQIKLHERNGGVVPELASQLHFQIIAPLLDEILFKAKLKLEDIDYFASTAGPGLPGALLIGFTFTKTLAWSQKKPFIPINHLEGHIYSIFLDNKEISFPFLSISVSGGHSHIYLVSSFNEYKLIGKTRDDACGECFDKIAKLLRLPYPGGKYIEQIAMKWPLLNTRNYTISNLQDGTISFSGLKTAVLYDLIKNGYYDQTIKSLFAEVHPEFIESVATSTQYVITHMLLAWVDYFINLFPEIKSVAMVGGVACNNIITDKMNDHLSLKNISFYSPSQKFCCDNADMIAFVASQKISSNNYEPYNYTQSILI